MWILAAFAVAVLLVGFLGRTREGFDVSPTCATGTIIDELKRGCTSVVDKACPESTVIDPSIKKCRAGNDMSGRILGDPQCPPATVERPDGKCSKNADPPTCPAGYKYQTKQVPGGDMLLRSGICVSNTQSAPDDGTTGDDISRTSGTTTGGTSGTTQGANSGGGKGNKQKVFGPLFMGQGEPGLGGPDTSTTNKYPELLGGDGGRASTRIEGGGLVNPSGSGITMPPLGSLGLNEGSGLFPFSRQPGDMDLIPDPYRVSQQFSASSYSSKTEPVPFLTDFSAFQR